MQAARHEQDPGGEAFAGTSPRSMQAEYSTRIELCPFAAWQRKAWDVLICSHSSFHGAYKKEPLRQLWAAYRLVDSIAPAVGLDRKGPHVVDVECVIRRVFCARVGNTRLSEGEVSTEVDDVVLISSHEVSISRCYQVARERAPRAMKSYGDP
jgi:hypothetical protein